MRNVETIINKIRLLTDNENFNDQAGIQTDEILEHLNDAQDRIYSQIQKAHDNFFLNRLEVSTASGQKNVDIPTDAYLGYRIVKVEYKGTGDTNYSVLKKGANAEEFTGNGGYPSFYIRYDDYIVLNPKPNNVGQIRWTYQRKVPTLDITRGTVDAVTLATDSITSLTLDTATLTQDNIDEIVNSGYMCVSLKRTGVVTMKLIPIDSIVLATGVVTVDSAFTFDDDETIAVGSLVSSGELSTTVSNLPNNIERYFKAYAAWKLLKRDSSTDSIEQNAELIALEDDIVSSFAELDMDIEYPAIIDTQFLASEWH